MTLSCLNKYFNQISHMAQYLALVYSNFDERFVFLILLVYNFLDDKTIYAGRKYFGKLINQLEK